MEPWTSPSFPQQQSRVRTLTAPTPSTAAEISGSKDKESGPWTRGSRMLQGRAQVGMSIRTGQGGGQRARRPCRERQQGVPGKGRVPGPRAGAGTHHDGNAGEENSRDKLPDSGETWRGRSEADPSLPPPGPTPGPSPLQAKWRDSWSGGGNQGRDYTGPLPTALPPSNTHRSMLT